MRDLNAEEKIWLEKTLDAAGLQSVLMALSEACGAIATIIAVDHQDARLAKRYATMEGAIGCIVPQARGL
jgi:hypothetical protein